MKNLTPIIQREQWTKILILDLVLPQLLPNGLLHHITSSPQFPYLYEDTNKLP